MPLGRKMGTPYLDLPLTVCRGSGLEGGKKVDARVRAYRAPLGSAITRRMVRRGTWNFWTNEPKPDFCF